jgi:hypothetical protein
MALYYDKCEGCPLHDEEIDCYSQITGANHAYCDRVNEDDQVAEVVQSLSHHQDTASAWPLYRPPDPLREALRNGYYDENGDWQAY